ncbi:MAG TPA: ABC transporter permease [Patescibacteria group bacterium]|nr:ABC transporter permease [Patescibacteria group bacterium]
MHSGLLLLIIVAVLAVAKLVRGRMTKPKPGDETKALRPVKYPKLYAVSVFARLNTRRFFRDRLAIFFGVLFPLIFLFVFGGIFGHNKGTSFKVAFLNQSTTQSAVAFAKEATHSKLLKVDSTITTMAQAQEKMTRSQLDATIILPKDFGTVKAGQSYPSGKAQLVYTQSNEQAGQALGSILTAQFQQLNGKYVSQAQPFSVKSVQQSNKSLSQFDYTFAGLLGFSIIGMGIFGPINVFPELKKQGILRRLHTTPLRVWQYFISTMISQALIGLVSLGVMFAVAITVFHLHVVGNWVLIAAWLVFSITMILGIGLSIGGWAKNERQAAPLSNIIVFPMLFLSGTFFPRFLMPEWLQGATNFLPLTPVIDGIRLIATEGKGILELGPQIGLIAAWIVVIYIIAFRVFRWE